jgi:hypothetical protein
MDFQKAYDSVRRCVLYHFLTVWGTHEAIMLIRMCSNATYSKVRIAKHLSDKFQNQNGLKQGYILMPLRWVRKIRWDSN